MLFFFLKIVYNFESILRGIKSVNIWFVKKFSWFFEKKVDWNYVKKGCPVPSYFQ